MIHCVIIFINHLIFKGEIFMGKISVVANVPEKKEGDKVVQKAVGPYTINVECPNTIAEMVKVFGEDAVKANAVANWIITLQGSMRSAMKKGLTLAQIQTNLGNAKMGVAVKGIKIDPEQAFIAMFENSDPAKQAEMLAALKQKAKK
jgi:hypothetical protein